MGLFGGNYERAGVGIAKNAPKKKGFRRYFEIFGRKFWKLMELNLLYFMFFLPLIGAVMVLFVGSIPAGTAQILMIAGAILFAVLFGPATAAHTKILKNFFMEKPTFIVHDFFHTLRSEFKHACVVGILDCVLVCSISASFYVYPKLIEQTGNKLFYVFFAITLSVGLVVLLMNFYAFLMMISTNLSLKHVLKNSLALAVVALKKNLVVLLIVGGTVALYALALFFLELQYSMILLFLLPVMPASWLGLAIVVQCYPMIQKYIINPYYEQRGEVNPELMQGVTAEEDEPVFEDMGGKEKPIEPEKKGKPGNARRSSGTKTHKGKIIN